MGCGEQSRQPSSGPPFRTAWAGWGDTLRAGFPLPVCAKHTGSSSSRNSSQLSSEADGLAPIFVDEETEAQRGSSTCPG